jgi:hypothetical protein
MAGIVVPTLVLLLALTGFIILRFVCDVPVPIERLIVFPMGIVPNLFGLWNMLYLRLHEGRSFAIGLHGALLPLVLVPIGYFVGSSLNLIELHGAGIVYFQMVTVPYVYFAIGLGCAMIVYYLVWKYLIGFFNRVLGIA